MGGGVVEEVVEEVFDRLDTEAEGGEVDFAGEVVVGGAGEVGVGGGVYGLGILACRRQIDGDPACPVLPGEGRWEFTNPRSSLPRGHDEGWSALEGAADQEVLGKEDVGVVGAGREGDTGRRPGDLFRGEAFDGALQPAVGTLIESSEEGGGRGSGLVHGQHLMLSVL